MPLNQNITSPFCTDIIKDVKDNCDHSVRRKVRFFGYGAVVVKIKSSIS